MNNEKKSTNAIVLSNPRQYLPKEVDHEILEHDPGTFDPQSFAPSTNPITNWLDKIRDTSLIARIHRRTAVIDAFITYLIACKEERERHYDLMAVEEREAINRVGRMAEMDRALYLREKNIRSYVNEFRLADSRAELEWEKLDLEKLKITVAKAELIYGPRKEIERKKDEKLEAIDQIKEQILAIKSTEDELRKIYRDDPESVDEIVNIYKKTLVQKGVIGDIDDDL
jgi:hypothetical protein